ncbi:hypothetical protein AC230_16740 [Streptomyces caatingaensis]|uniref:Uncharacterized protein n=1 Tax=Streptomyces caatingaensis TaxID=1678637 RepID=A0A0K9XFC7_9ACTN|nr:hypothetical protein AC230_16740 [Streptomyces caatingaensis]
MWDAVVLAPLGQEEHANIEFLVEADPYFTLRFRDGRATEAEVRQSDNGIHLRLRSVPEP